MIFMKSKFTSFALLFCAFVIGTSQVQAQYITTYAGTGYGAGMSFGGRSGDGGPAYLAEFFKPTGVAHYGYVNVYVADNANHVVRKIDHLGYISTLAGNDQVGYTWGGDSTAATASMLSNPYALVVDSTNNVYFSDYTNNVVYKVDTSGIIHTIAGNDTAGYSGDDSAATNARLNHPLGIALDKYNNIYIADALNNVVRKVDAVTGIITTVAGNGYGHGLSLGHGGYSGDGGFALAAKLNYPSGVAVDVYGNLFIADASNNVIRKVDNATQKISTFAGAYTGSYGTFGGDGGPAIAAGMLFPSDVAVDGPGNVYIADQGNNNIRKVTTDGKINTIAGNHAAGYAPDNHIATTSQLNAPTTISVDGNGLIYVADSRNNAVRLIGPASVVNGVRNINSTSAAIKIFPNPANGSFTASLPEMSSPAVITVMDMTGRTLKTATMANAGAQNAVIDLAGIPTGNYIVNINCADNNYHQKVTVVAE